MQDKQLKPKMELPPTNVPTVVEFKKMFKVTEHPEYGKTWCWDIVHEGVNKTWFVKEGLQKKLDEANATGKTLTVTYKELRNEETNKPYHAWVVGDGKEALFEGDGKPTPKQSEGMAWNEYDAIQRAVMATCVNNARGMTPGMTTDNLTSIACTMYIQTMRQLNFKVDIPVPIEFEMGKPEEGD